MRIIIRNEEPHPNDNPETNQVASSIGIGSIVFAIVVSILAMAHTGCGGSTAGPGPGGGDDMVDSSVPKTDGGVVPTDGGQQVQPDAAPAANCGAPPKDAYSMAPLQWNCGIDSQPGNTTNTVVVQEYHYDKLAVEVMSNTCYLKGGSTTSSVPLWETEYIPDMILDKIPALPGKPAVPMRFYFKVGTAQGGSPWLCYNYPETATSSP